MFCFVFLRKKLAYTLKHMEDVIVIGGGVIGAFIARNLSRYELSTLVLEKENDVGNVTSMANSAIVHSGYDPVPGTKKARFNVEGNKMYPSVCKELDVDFEQCGSLTIALDEKQKKVLEDLAVRAKENGVEAKLLTGEEARAMEKNLSSDCVAALLCPTAGIVNPFNLVAHCFENALDNGVKLHLGEEVVEVKEENGLFKVKTKKDTYEAKVVINAAGLKSEEFARMMDDISWTINPRKGEYYVLDHFDSSFVNHVLFPLPSEKGKGILVIRTTSNDYLIGPSSEYNGDKEDMSTDSPTLGKVKAEASEMVKNIPFYEQIRVFAGLRATPSTHDFIIEPSKSHPHFINVAGIESPGLASSPAIGKYVVEELVSKILPLKAKASYKKEVRPYVHPNKMSAEERDALIKSNPDYGDIICNCEKVSLGEIKDVLSRSVPCRTIKAVKKRTRAGFGKCQGGFCQPKVLLLLAKYFGVSPLDILYDKDGSNILKEASK